MNFKEYLRICEAFNDYPLGTVVPNNNAFGAVSGDWSGTLTAAGGASPQQPARTDMTLELPSVIKTGTLNVLDREKNPIFLFFTCDDGSYLRTYMSFDEFERVKGDPQVGKRATIVMQRRQDDTSNLPSKIDAITFH